MLQADRDFLGVTLEDVSDSEDETSLKITEPLKWLEAGRASESRAADAANRRDLEEQAERVASNAVEVAQMPRQNEVEEIMRGFQAQIRSLSEEVRELRQAMNNQPRRKWGGKEEWNGEMGGRGARSGEQKG